MSWTDVLKGYPLDWLLEPSDPSVRFWSLQQLLDRPLDAPEVRDAQDAVMESHPVRAILTAQGPQGYWDNPEDMYNPKYRATTHSHSDHLIHFPDLTHFHSVLIVQFFQCIPWNYMSASSPCL